MPLDIQRLKAAVAEVLEIPMASLNNEVEFESLTEYDSIKSLSLMIVLDEFGLILSQNDVEKFKTFSDILRAAESKSKA